MKFEVPKAVNDNPNAEVADPELWERMYTDVAENARRLLEAAEEAKCANSGDAQVRNSIEMLLILRNLEDAITRPVQSETLGGEAS